MALYRLEAKIIGRSIGKTKSAVAASAYRSAGKLGSVVAASAYRSGSKMRDEHTGTRHDYSRRGKGVIESTILAPENAPARASFGTKLRPVKSARMLNLHASLSWRSRPNLRPRSNSSWRWIG